MAATAQVTDDLIVSGTQGLRDADGQLLAVGSVGQPQLASVSTRPVFALPMQVPVGQPGWDNSLGERLHRITSYNVCYTKLLRYQLLNGCSVVTAPYQVNEKVVGVLGVIGHITSYNVCYTKLLRAGRCWKPAANLLPGPRHRALTAG